MLNFFTSFINTTNGNFPTTKAKNSSSGSATDGTHFTVSFVDDVWGFMQALLTKAGLTPSGNVDVSGNSQIVEAVEKVALDYVTDNAGSDDFENQSGVAGATISAAMNNLNISTKSYTQIAISYKGETANTDLYWSINKNTLTGWFGSVTLSGFASGSGGATIDYVSGTPLPSLALDQNSNIVRLLLDSVFIDGLITRGSGSNWKLLYISDTGAPDADIPADTEFKLVSSAFKVLKE